MKAVYWAYGAATVGSFLAFAASLYLYGVTTPFFVYIVRSLTVVWLTFVLVFAATFKLIEHAD